MPLSRVEEPELEVVRTTNTTAIIQFWWADQNWISTFLCNGNRKWGNKNYKFYFYLRFEVFTAVTMKNAFF
jgi:hypothetical protein